MQVFTKRGRARLAERNVGLRPGVGDRPANSFGLRQQTPFTAYGVVAEAGQLAGGYCLVNRGECSFRAGAAPHDIKHVDDLVVLGAHAVPKELVFREAGGNIHTVKLALTQVHGWHAKQTQTLLLDDAFKLVERPRKKEMQIQLASLDTLKRGAQPRHFDKPEFVRKGRIFLKRTKAGVPPHGHLEQRLVFIKADLFDLASVQPRNRFARRRLGGNADRQTPAAEQLH